MNVTVEGTLRLILKNSFNCQQQIGLTSIAFLLASASMYLFLQCLDNVMITSLHFEQPITKCTAKLSG